MHQEEIIVNEVALEEPAVEEKHAEPLPETPSELSLSDSKSNSRKTRKQNDVIQIDKNK